MTRLDLFKSILRVYRKLLIYMVFTRRLKFNQFRSNEIVIEAKQAFLFLYTKLSTGFVYNHIGSET